MLPHLLQCATRSRSSAVAPHQLAGSVGVPPDAEREYDLALLPGGQLERNLDRRAGIQGGSHLAGKPLPRHGSRMLQCAVAPDEFGPVAAHAARRLAGVEESDPVGEFRAERVAREQRTAFGVDFGDHVHDRFRPQIAEHPLGVSGGGEPARPARFVAQLDHRELDRCVRRHVDPDLRADAAFLVLEHAVAESVPADVGRRPAHGQRHRRPEVAAVLVAQVEGLTARIAHRVVVPGTEAELVGVLAPGVAESALGDDAAEVRVRQDVHPRHGRDLPRRGRNDILAPVGGEASETVEEDQVGARRQGRRRGVRVVRPDGLQTRRRRSGVATAMDLLRQRSAAVGENRAGDCLHQNAVLARYVLRRSYEDAARPVYHAGFDARGDQPHDLVVELLPIAGVILVPDDQVRGQPLQAPVGVGAHQLAHQIDVGRIPDLQQHERQVAGDGVAPQSRLPAAVLHDDGRVGAQCGIRVDDRTGKASVELRVGLGGVDLPQEHLAVRPRELEDAVREPPILVLLHQAQRRVAGFADARDDVDRRRLFRLERDPVADRDDRIEHRALGARERREIAHRLRIGNGVAAPDETHAVGFVGDIGDLRAVHGHQMQQPGRRLVPGARPPGAEDRLARSDDLGLDEEVAEGRMQRVRDRRCEHDFRVTRHLDLPGHARAVGDADPAQLDVVLRRYRDLGVHVEVEVAAAELRSRLREDRLVVVRPLEGRLMRGGPDLPARHVADIAECAPVVASAVLAPAREGDVLPPAVAAARVADHHVVPAVRQQLDFRHRRVGVAEHVHRRLRIAGGAAQVGELAGVRVKRRRPGNAFLEQQRRRAEQRVRFESLLHRAVEDEMGEREQAHARVVRHE